MDSLALGRHFLPCIEKLATRIPDLQYAVLCTPDGFNLCSLGLNEEQVGKIAALSSSLFSVGNAAVSSLSAEGEAAGLEFLTLESRGLQIVSTKIVRPAGNLILMAAARSPLGVVLVGIKSTVADVYKLL